VHDGKVLCKSELLHNFGYTINSYGKKKNLSEVFSGKQLRQVIHALQRIGDQLLSARQTFTQSCRCENFKTYKSKAIPLQGGLE
jgi:hypothetical protein